MKIPLGSDLLLIKGSSSFLLVGKADELFVLCIETSDREVCQTVEKGDLIVVSAPEGGEIDQARMILELVRTYHQPLLVLPKKHPGTKRLKMVVSAGPDIVPRCDIVRGTHPEQNVICASDELSKISLYACDGGVIAEGIESGDDIYTSYV
ncbi:hypothetical protein F1737_09870 [Methanoplanus sp. FWC-SCC4]|uniref:Uncharacterized protein n=1 Tax=Methanochimaera problematica TaxID=2609417 RepID=A0AA97FGF0_9EURY|nr:hypothetical protein [Methanoplanus sp. FWC-SCC4]WOF16971.1 hypothetical protein F1737_09870 [Methanoplanus sp. FWC-SCC4]